MIHRNQSIYIAILFVLLCGFKPPSSRKEVHKQTITPPNIILIVADDLTWRDSEPYGNTEVKTPHLATLAEQGMTFYGMHTATAMCSPTRQQLYTGLFPVRNGAWPNHSWSYKGVKSLPQYLRPLGYRVGIAGKQDVGPPDSYPFKDVGSQGPFTEHSYNAIKDFITQRNDQPFALVVASHQPHKHWTKGNPGVYDADKLTIPPYLEDTPVTRRQLTKYYAEITYLDQQVGKILNILDQSGKKDNTLVLFTSEQGAQFPFAKWTCYENGLKTAFIARWPGHIKSGTTNHALTQYVDVVPTLLEAAGGNPDIVNPGRPDALGHRGFDGKSFLPVLLNNRPNFREYVYGVHTTLGIIGAEAAYPIRSVSDGRFKLIRNLNAEAKFSNITNTSFDNELIQAWFKAGEDNLNKLYRTQYYYKRPSIEFYDLRKDPYEMHNLAGDPQYNEKVKELNQKLKAWLHQQGDKGLETELQAHSRLGRVISKN